MKFQLLHPRANLEGDRASPSTPNPMILTERCFGVIGTYHAHLIVLCHDAPSVAVRHGLILWDDDRIMIPYWEDMLQVNEQLYSDWEVME